MTQNITSRLQTIPTILQEGLKAVFFVQGEINTKSCVGMFQSAGVGHVLYIASIHLEGDQLHLHPEESSSEKSFLLSNF